MSHLISNKDGITEKKKLIIEKSQALGFDSIGFANPKLPKSVKKNLDSFLKSNFHGEMDWLAKNKHRRESPENLWSDVKTIIVFLSKPVFLSFLSILPICASTKVVVA